MTPITRRGALALGLALPALLAGPLRAQGFPSRPVRLIVPFPPGAGPDQAARLLAPYLRDALGQAVVVENRTGALGAIAAQETARSAPDGHTIIIGTNTTHAANVAMIRNLQYDPVADFAPISRLITTAMILVVRPDFPATDLASFIAHARSLPPGTLTAGFGSGAAQMSIAQLRARGGVEMVPVPYRGIPIAAGDVIGGSLNATFVDYAIGLPHIQANTLRGLGVTSAARSELVPGMPPISETLPGFDVTIWWGLFAPARTPQPIVSRIAELCEAWLRVPETRERMATIGISPAFMGPEEFAGFVRAEVVRWTQQAREAGIEPQ
jgi:tripartite-type tricarboxylate transporter receptor subunit TctC